MNIDHIYETLGWRPRESLESGLLKTVTWYLDNPEWVSALLSESGYQQWLGKNYKGRKEII